MRVQKLFADATMALEDLHSVAVEGQRRDMPADKQLVLSAPLSPFSQRYLTESGGRWGGTATRQQNYAMSQELKSSTGIRRQELIDLNLYDLDRERGVVMIREGKGRKDRMIPIGARALAWIDKYMEDVRPDLASGADDGTLFLSTYGQPLGVARLAEIVRDAVNDSGIGKRGSCHMFRHTMATLMLENGADVRFIQAMLGHSDLKTTELYTQVSIKALKAVHTATHPARPITRAGVDGATPPGAADLDALFDTLDREAEHEDA